LQKINGKSFAVLQFEQLPSESSKQELAASGIQLLEYISGNAYTICITKNMTQQFCRKQEQDQFLNYRLSKDASSNGKRNISIVGDKDTPGYGGMFGISFTGNHISLYVKLKQLHSRKDKY
jgi:hypothetical protein